MLGILLVGIAVLAIGFWMDVRRAAGGASASAAPPPITLIEPTSGAVVESPLPVLFEAPVRLRWVAGGWQAGQLHIHAEVSGSELMPGARDIQPLGENRYRWTLPPLPPGEHTLRLFWSGPDHGALAEGASRPVTMRVR
ncbi:MAG TPA: hypothetical protein VGR27_03060 [Longimicrobiaceae bacterium]|nr:hypothetical protein [Longimicrobiaceae bacterium]